MFEQLFRMSKREVTISRSLYSVRFFIYVHAKKLLFCLILNNSFSLNFKYTQLIYLCTSIMLMHFRQFHTKNVIIKHTIKTTIQTTTYVTACTLKMKISLLLRFKKKKIVKNSSLHFSFIKIKYSFFGTYL